MINACKKCRREGEKLLLKGDKCLSPKCTFIKKPYAPGDHGQGFRRKLSEYGRQLREKQKARSIYGINESQFEKYTAKAESMVGNSTENLFTLVESRLDNLIYRLGFAPSRSMARQLVSHGSFTLNGKRANIASIQLKPGDIIKPKDISRFKEIKMEKLSFVSVDDKKMEVTIKSLPTQEDIETMINLSLIIEYYSR